MVRSEQVRTFFYGTESQESKSEVLSISDLSCSAFPELVIASLKLISISNLPNFYVSSKYGNFRVFPPRLKHVPFLGTISNSSNSPDTSGLISMFTEIKSNHFKIEA